MINLPLKIVLFQDNDKKEIINIQKNNNISHLLQIQIPHLQIHLLLHQVQ